MRSINVSLKSAPRNSKQKYSTELEIIGCWNLENTHNKKHRNMSAKKLRSYNLQEDNKATYLKCLQARTLCNIRINLGFNRLYSMNESNNSSQLWVQ